MDSNGAYRVVAPKDCPVSYSAFGLWENPKKGRHPTRAPPLNVSIRRVLGFVQFVVIAVHFRIEVPRHPKTGIPVNRAGGYRNPGFIDWLEE